MELAQAAIGPGEAQIATEIHIDTSQIPDTAGYVIGSAVMDMYRSILRSPGGREALDARTAARHAAAAARTKKKKGDI